MSNKDEKNEDKAVKRRKTTRSRQKPAAQSDAAFSYNEQEENNRLLALRIEERKAARPDMAVKDVIKDGTPEEKAILRLKDYDLIRMGGKNFLSKEEIRELHFSYETTEDKAVFLNYLKLYSDLFKYADRLLGVIKMYEVEVALLSKLIDKYEALDRDLLFYDILYGSLVGTKGHSDMEYNLHDNDRTKMKRLDDTTPEALLEEFNDIYKNDGVVFKDPKQDGTLVADIDFKGGLYDQIKEQAEKTTRYLSYVKAYIEPVEEYIEENYYSDFVPSSLVNIINDIKEQKFSRRIIANEYHLSRLNDKRKNGEAITKKEEYEAVVPDYREVVPDQEVKDSCYKCIRDYRNAAPKLR